MSDQSIQVFEQIKKLNEFHSEYWTARDLAKVLEYSDYRNFETAIKKAKQSCKNSGQSIQYHFVDFTETIEMPKSASKNISNIMLSRYACYLIMQNADPSKEIVAQGQTYFAIQTRRRENIQGEARANQTHFAVGKKVRQTIKELGGTMPERLLTSAF